jgi:hypothetical protein
MLTTKYSKANHTKGDDMEGVRMEDVRRACKIVIEEHTKTHFGYIRMEKRIIQTYGY